MTHVRFIYLGHVKTSVAHFVQANTAICCQVRMSCAVRHMTNCQQAGISFHQH